MGTKKQALARGAVVVAMTTALLGTTTIANAAVEPAAKKAGVSHSVDAKKA